MQPGGTLRERAKDFFFFGIQYAEIDVISERKVMTRELQFAWYPCCRFAGIGVLLTVLNIVYSSTEFQTRKNPFGDGCASTFLAW